MSPRRILLLVNGVFLVLASAGGMVNDLAGIYFGKGPVAAMLGSAPHAGIGFVEAHGLAFILGVLLVQAQPSRLWHFTGASIHLLLGAANVAFWQVFVAGDALVVGYVTTAAHALFFALQLCAAITLRH